MYRRLSLNILQHNYHHGYHTAMASTSKSTLTIGTPIRATADFCLLPVSSDPPPPSPRPCIGVHSGVGILIAKQVGTSSPSVSKQIADVQRLMKCSGLSYTMHSAGTTVGNSPRDSMTLFWPVMRHTPLSFTR